MVKQFQIKQLCFCTLILLALTSVSGAGALAQNLDAATQKLFSAAQRNHINSAKAAIRDGADLNAKNARGSTAVDIAIDKGHFYLVQYLLSVRDKKDAGGQSKPIVQNKKMASKKGLPKPKPIPVADQLSKPAPVQDISAFKPPAYPPSKPRPRVAEPMAQVLVPAHVATLKKTAEPKAIFRAPPKPNQTVIKTIEPSFAKDEEKAKKETERPQLIFAPIDVVVVPQPLEPVLEPEIKVETKLVVLKNPTPKPIASVVTFTPDTKRIDDPIRTFFLKDMVSKSPPVEKTQTRAQHSKIQRIPKLALGSVKPAGDERNILRAPDFPTLPRRLSKSKVDAISVEQEAGKVRCEDVASAQNNTRKNTSSSVVIDLPPMNCR